MDAEFINAPKTYIIKGKKGSAIDATSVDNSPALPASAYIERGDIANQKLAQRTPSDVSVVFNPALLKSKMNYGLWDTKDIRPLATIPLAIGLYGAINETK